MLFSVVQLFKRVYMFIFVFYCIGSLLLCVGFFSSSAVGAAPELQCAGFFCGGVSCSEAQALGTLASVAVAHGLSSVA